MLFIFIIHVFLIKFSLFSALFCVNNGVRMTEYSEILLFLMSAFCDESDVKIIRQQCVYYCLSLLHS